MQLVFFSKMVQLINNNRPLYRKFRWASTLIDTMESVINLTEWPNKLTLLLMDLLYECSSSPIHNKMDVYRHRFIMVSINQS